MDRVPTVEVHLWTLDLWMNQVLELYSLWGQQAVKIVLHKLDKQVWHVNIEIIFLCIKNSWRRDATDTESDWLINAKTSILQAN